MSVKHFTKINEIDILKNNQYRNYRSENKI